MNRSIRKGRCQVLIIWTETHAETIRHRGVVGIHGVLGPGIFDVGPFFQIIMGFFVVKWRFCLV